VKRKLFFPLTASFDVHLPYGYPKADIILDSLLHWLLAQILDFSSMATHGHATEGTISFLRDHSMSQTPTITMPQ